jgi:hypothetical protein
MPRCFTMRCVVRSGLLPLLRGVAVSRVRSIRRRLHHGGARGGLAHRAPQRAHSSLVYEVFAHELCDVVVAVREFRHDPCRREDDGKIRVRRIGAPDPYYP